jgi:hypothetical protein
MGGKRGRDGGREGRYRMKGSDVMVQNEGTGI